MLLAVRTSSYGCTWEVWRALKKLELLSAAPRATLTLLSCSPNFPRASITRCTHAKHEPILNSALIWETIHMPKVWTDFFIATCRRIIKYVKKHQEVLKRFDLLFGDSPPDCHVIIAEFLVLPRIDIKPGYAMRMLMELGPVSKLLKQSWHGLHRTTSKLICFWIYEGIEYIPFYSF